MVCFINNKVCVHVLYLNNKNSQPGNTRNSVEQSRFIFTPEFSTVNVDVNC